MSSSQLPTTSEGQLPWWRLAGFLWHPFERMDAAQEEYLIEYFVEPLNFWMTAGRQHAVLYAPLGGGKTAARTMLERLCAAGDIVSTVVVTCDDFGRVLRRAENDPGQVTADMLVEEVMRQAAAIVFEHWMRNIESFQETTVFHRLWVARFLDDWETQCAEVLRKTGLIERISVGDVGKGPSKELNDRVGDEHWPWIEMLAMLAVLRERRPEEQTAKEWFERLSAMARQLGFEATYILFDKVDGLPETSQPEGCVALIRHLLDAKALLSIPNLYFKLFLPFETQPLLTSLAGVQSEWVGGVVMEWDQEKLKLLLRKRLLEASGGKCEGLEAISEPDIKTIMESQLVRYGSTPRHLLRLGQRLFAEHQRLAPESLYLMKKDLDAALCEDKRTERAMRASQRGEQLYRIGVIGTAALSFVFMMLALLVGHWWTPILAVVSIAAFIELCWLVERHRRLQTGQWELYEKWQLVLRSLGLAFLAVFTCVIALVWLPSLFRFTTTSPLRLPGTSMWIFSSHPRWGILGSESEIRVTLEEVTTPVTITVKASQMATIEWPNDNTSCWGAENSAETHSLSTRFVNPGWTYYQLEAEWLGEKEEVDGDFIFVLPLPAPLVSKGIPLVGALVSAVVTAFSSKIATWLSRGIPQLFAEGGE